ncbi:MAG: hypothetical protein ISS71_01920 [Phycisphaerae bacterium]|nr:hypothetical protein [Phycisphaerae bacterium]
MNPLFSLLPAIVGTVVDGQVTQNRTIPNESVGAINESYSAKHTAQRAERQVKILEANLAKTMMICESLWELLAERTGLTEQELYQKILEVDIRDDVQDNKNQRKATQCPKCQRTVSARHAACLYCGEVIDQSIFNLS